MHVTVYSYISCQQNSQLFSQNFPVQPSWHWQVRSGCRVPCVEQVMDGQLATARYFKTCPEHSCKCALRRTANVWSSTALVLQHYSLSRFITPFKEAASVHLATSMVSKQFLKINQNRHTLRAVFPLPAFIAVTSPGSTFTIARAIRRTYSFCNGKYNKLHVYGNTTIKCKAMTISTSECLSGSFQNKPVWKKHH